MNTYMAFYRNKKIEIKANTSLEAQTIAAREFKAKKRYQVNVIIVADKNGKAVVHKPMF